MASEKEYMILRPNRARVWDFVTLVFSSKSLSKYDFVDTNTQASKSPMNITSRLFILIFLFYSIICSLTSGVGNKFKSWLEYFLNNVLINGGLFGLIKNTIKGSSRRPDPNASYFRSMHSFVSGEVEDEKKLESHLGQPDHEASYFQSEHGLVPNDLPGQKMLLHAKPNFLRSKLDTSVQEDGHLELAAFASKLAYENQAHIKDIVNSHLKMDFVEFFKGWNLYVKAYTTKAFICCDKREDAELIIVSFRGTDSIADWRCNLNLSFISMANMGKVHLGFMTALGLQDTYDTEIGFPKEYNGNKQLAYYSIREVLRGLLKKHKNAKILVTGHSLGGALSILYTSLLVMHEEHDILKRISGVMTFGQPRVGDACFGEAMVSILGKKYTRMVYRHDIVPRIPFEIPVIDFKHFGTCISYNSWYYGKNVSEVPNRNYFNVLYILVKFWGAIEDFLRAIWVGEGFIATLNRLIWIIFPGVAFHNTKNYVNASKKAKITY
ncbi:Triacylglycerol lipase protein [Dioscorea alata]|uniref:Triacylglycerol lipase protein n=1 Tax=Dioscorea alata TaxID=55571 RepID=A0ACB7VS36_DIOAL|nr:Triacylglycerol lipase protein [Dioscorea alata]